MLLLRADIECEASLRCVGIDGERAPVHVISAGTRGPDPDAHRVSADLWLALIHPSAIRSCHLNSAESAFQILRKRERYLVRCRTDCRANWMHLLVDASFRVLGDPRSLALKIGRQAKSTRAVVVSRARGS
jgi:hypothetical protein